MTVESKVEFVERLKKRTQTFAIDALKLCDKLPANINSTRIISNQLGRSASSTGANYRAACVARSKKEFYAKISITLEEADECNYWLHILQEGKFCADYKIISQLIMESEEIFKILFTARNSIKL
jgi:four helix bundle protein